MKLGFIKSALVSFLVLAPLSALAESGLVQFEDRQSCETLKDYYPVVKSQLAFAQKSSSEAQRLSLIHI